MYETLTGVEKAEEVCKDRMKWQVLLALKRNRRENMYVCKNNNNVLLIVSAINYSAFTHEKIIINILDCQNYNQITFYMYVVYIHI